MEKSIPYKQTLSGPKNHLINTLYEGEIIKVTCSFGIFISVGLTDLDDMIRNDNL